MTSFSPLESWSVLGALNLSVPTNHEKLKQIHARGVDFRKMSQTLAKAADEAACSPPPGLEAPPGLSPSGRRFSAPPGLGLEAPPGLLLPVGLSAPPGLALPDDLPNRSKWPAKSPKKRSSGSIDRVESDAEGTSAGTGSMKDCGSSDHEEPESEGEEFQMKANAPCFVPGLLVHTLPSQASGGQQKTPLRTPPWHAEGMYDPANAPYFVPVLFSHTLPSQATQGQQKTPSITGNWRQAAEIHQRQLDCSIKGDWRKAMGGQQKTPLRTPLCKGVGYSAPMLSPDQAAALNVEVNRNENHEIVHIRVSKKA